MRWIYIDQRAIDTIKRSIVDEISTEHYWINLLDYVIILFSLPLPLTLNTALQEIDKNDGRKTRQIEHPNAENPSR